MSWQEAALPVDGSLAFSVRITLEEKHRLEQLRQELRLTSKGQVIRAALDLLEATAVGGDALAGSETDTTRRAARRLRRAVGVPRRSDVEAAPSDDARATGGRTVTTSYRHVLDSPVGFAGSPSEATGETQGVL